MGAVQTALGYPADTVAAGEPDTAAAAAEVAV